MRLNNKGQSLVLFILILPILFFILLIVYDIGNIIVEKQKLNSINSIVIDYGLSNIDNNNMNDRIKEVVKRNDKKIEVSDISITNNELKVKLSKEVEGILTSLINIKKFNIISTYKGKIENGKKKIERVNR